MRTITERNLSGVDLNLLVVFDAMMAERNVTRAALRNGLSQPAVSKALNRLRYLFHDPLFVRRDRGMEPTPRALELAGPIHFALTEISKTLGSPLAFDPRSVCASVSVAATDVAQSSVVPALILKLRQDAPGVHLHVKTTARSTINVELESGELDLAIGPTGALQNNIKAKRLWRDRLVTLASAKNPIIGALTVESFAAASHAVDAGHVQVADGGEVASVVDSVLAAYGLKRRVAAVLPTSAALPFVVAATDLIATLPSGVLRGLLVPESVRVLEAPFPGVEVSSHLLWHTRTETAPLHVWIRSAIVEVIQAVRPTTDQRKFINDINAQDACVLGSDLGKGRSK
jgi:DNA-binding transcriptional LysR family regulator